MNHPRRAALRQTRLCVHCDDVIAKSTAPAAQKIEVSTNLSATGSALTFGHVPASNRTNDTGLAPNVTTHPSGTEKTQQSSRNLTDRDTRTSPSQVLGWRANLQRSNLRSQRPGQPYACLLSTPMCARNRGIRAASLHTVTEFRLQSRRAGTLVGSKVRLQHSTQSLY